MLYKTVAPHSQDFTYGEWFPYYTYRQNQSKVNEVSAVADKPCVSVHHACCVVMLKLHYFDLLWISCAFSALTPLAGHQEEHPACKRIEYEVLTRLSV